MPGLVPEAFVEVTVCSSEGQCVRPWAATRSESLVYKNIIILQERTTCPVSLGGVPVRAAELLARLERGEEAWVPDLQSSDESADEGPVKPPLKQLPKGGMWWGRYRSSVTCASSNSSNSDDELESEAEEEKPQRGGQRLMVIHRNLLASSKGDGFQNLKLRHAYKNGPQQKKHPPNRVGVIGESSVKERAIAAGRKPYRAPLPHRLRPVLQI
uniref:Uncharacterized protein n=1 Tax=Sphaerodactylus townsendi TaxID=933632 RepID=A0ACB8EG74_9SAUR